MEQKIKALIQELKKENSERTEKLNSGKLEQSVYSPMVHLYNHTLTIIAKLEKCLG